MLKQLMVLLELRYLIRHWLLVRSLIDIGSSNYEHEVVEYCVKPKYEIIYVETCSIKHGRNVQMRGRDNNIYQFNYMSMSMSIS
jgi:hypothetical protein